MKFSDFLKLNEDEGGGGGEGGGFDAFIGNNQDTTSPGNTTDNIAYGAYPLGAVFLRNRIFLPQINTDLYQDFKNDLDINNISHKMSKRKASKLKPTQNEFDMDKVAKIKEKMKDEDYPHHPILISNDGYIVDGHHRWLAYDDYPGYINTHLVDLSYEDFYNYLQNKPYALRSKV